MTAAALQQLFLELSPPLAPQPTGLEPDTAGLRARPPRAVLLDVYGTMVLSAAGEIANDAGTSVSHDPVAQALAAERLDPALFGWDDLRAAITRRHAQLRADGASHPEVEIRSLWRQLLATAGVDAPAPLVERLAARCEIAANPCWPEPTLATTLARLAAVGIPLGIVSNAQFYTRAMLEAFLGRPLDAAGIRPELEAWSFAEGVGKPEPALYHSAARRLLDSCGIAAADTVMVGNDIRNDIAPARQAGLRGVLYAGDLRSLRLRRDDPQLAAERPHATITSLAQLADACLG